jgi:hypothetical protein
VSRKVYAHTMYLRGMLLPDDLGFCLRSLGAIGAAILFCCIIASFAATGGIWGIYTVGFLGLLLGFAADHAISDALRKREGGGGEGAVEGAKQTESAPTGTAAMRSLSVGGAAIGLMLAGHVYTSGVASHLQPLPMACKNSAAVGKWVVVDECQEPIRDVAYHDSGVAAFAGCGTFKSWGWDVQPPSSGCRFARRSRKELGNVLGGGRRVLFIGDSEVRNTFYGLAKLLGGEVPTGGEGEELKHTDVAIDVGTTHLQFVWAPLASDLGSKLDAEFAEGGKGADAVIAGGGLWDCLHNHDKLDE